MIRRFKGSFGRNVVASAGSSGVAAALTLITTPIMTRIFDADAYGMNGMLMTAGTLLSGMGMLGIPVALSREHSLPERMRLVESSVQLAVLLMGACLFAVVLTWLLPVSTTTHERIALSLLPFLVGVHAFQRITDSLLTARGGFVPQSVGRISGAVGSRGSTIVLGLAVQASAATMILGDVIGRSLHILVSYRAGQLGSEVRELRWVPNLKALFRTLGAYKDFVFHSNIASNLPFLAAFGIQLSLGARLDGAAVGHYVLAYSILSLPLSILAMATAPVLFHRFNLAADELPEALPGLAQRAALASLSLGLVCMLPVIIWGAELFAFFFGENWRPAGEAASILAIAQILGFAVAFLVPLFRVVRKIRTWLYFEAAGTAIILLGVGLSPIGGELIEAVKRISLALASYHLVMLSGCWWAVINHMQEVRSRSMGGRH